MILRAGLKIYYRGDNIMSEIEINKDDLNKAVATFGIAIDNLETASDTFDN